MADDGETAGQPGEPDKTSEQRRSKGGSARGSALRERTESGTKSVQLPKAMLGDVVEVMQVESDQGSPTSSPRKSGAPDPVGAPQVDFKLSFLTGMKDDLRRRAPHYRSDWTDGCHRKVVGASLFMFFTSIAPAVAFAAVLDLNTRVTVEANVPSSVVSNATTITSKTKVAQIGPVEVILSTAITGAIFSIFGGQPLCIVGVTGPVTIFTVAVFQLCDGLDVPFLQFYAWVQIFAGLMHAILALIGACDLIKLVTRYSCETFGMLIATIYIYTGLFNLGNYFKDKSLEAALMSFVICMGTAWLALTLTSARSWSLFSRTARDVIADYGATTAMIVFCFVPYVGKAYDLTPMKVGMETDATIATLDVPDSFATTSGRTSWLVNPLDDDIQVWAIALALVPALILTVLFFFDHNVSSLLCQAPEFGLKKGTSYHWDFFIVGIQLIVTGVLGIPPVNGLIPQAPLHTDSLSEKAFRTNADGKKEEYITDVHEQRVSNLAQAVLIGLTLAIIKVVGYLPIPALDGLFLYMGLASFAGNTFYERLVLLFTDNKLRGARGLKFLGPGDARVPLAIVNKYTCLQLFFLVVIFLVTQAPYIACFFPVFIAVLVPLRLRGLPKLFGTENVDLLDAEGEPAPIEIQLVPQKSLWKSMRGSMSRPLGTGEASRRLGTSSRRIEATTILHS